MDEKLKQAFHSRVEREPFLLAVQSEPTVVTATLLVAKQALDHLADAGMLASRR